MKKLLVGYIQDGRHSGIDKYLLNFASVAAEQGVRLDFLTDKIDPELQRRLSAYGFGLFEVPSLKHPLKQYKKIKRLIRSGGYDGVYMNISEAFNCMGIYAAAKCRVPVRIVHSHSSGVDRTNKYVRLVRTLIHRMFRRFLYRKSTRRLACAQVAGKWMYPGDFEIIYNAVDSARFTYDEKARLKMRQELGLEDRFVLIHIGHFCYAKNNFFLMDVMRAVVQREPDAVLLSVGTGADFDAVQAYARQLGIENNVRFLGVRGDVPALLCAADVFVFPSRIEGLSVTCVEAQFSGLPCVFSSKISPETKISDRVTFLPIDSTDAWAEAVFALRQDRCGARLERETVLHYDFSMQKNQLADILRGI